MSKKPKHYCGKCGEKCSVTKKKEDSFDTITGKQDYYYQVKCPNWNWFLDGIIFVAGHFNERVYMNAGGYFFYDAGNEFGPFGMDSEPLTKRKD